MRGDAIYRSMVNEDEVNNASQYQHIQMLFNKCQLHLLSAKSALLVNRDHKPEEINKAINIIEYLRACLKAEEPRALELASQLDELYRFCVNELVIAFNKNEVSNIENAIMILTNIKSGWDQIDPELKK